MLGLKNKRNSLRNEVFGLSMLVLLMAFFVMFLWSRLSPEKSQGLTDGHPWADIRELKTKTAYGPAVWRMNVKYRPQSGMLLVTLSHKHNAPTKGIKLVAHFSLDGIRPVVWARLQSRSNGNYRADDIYLDSGEWVMSVTGRRRSVLVFMREQPLLVR